MRPWSYGMIKWANIFAEHSGAPGIQWPTHKCVVNDAASTNVCACQEFAIIVAVCGWSMHVIMKISPELCSKKCLLIQWRPSNHARIAHRVLCMPGQVGILCYTYINTQTHSIKLYYYQFLLIFLRDSHHHNFSFSHSLSLRVVIRQIIFQCSLH